MSEPPAKRFRQQSITDFTFPKDTKPKKAATVLSSDFPVIDLSSSPGDSETVDDSNMDANREFQSPTKSSSLSSQKSVEEINTVEKSDEGKGINDGGARKRQLSHSPQASTSNKEMTEASADAHQVDKITESSLTKTQSYSMSPGSEPLWEESNSESQEGYERTPTPPPKRHEPLGIPLTQLKTSPKCAQRLPPLECNPNHQVLIKIPYEFSSASRFLPEPHPPGYKDKWDDEYVRLPCSYSNLYPINQKKRKRWEVIEEALHRNILTASDLKSAILSYNVSYAHKWDFSALSRLLTEEFSVDERSKFFDTTLPKMINLALKLPHLCTQPIRLLKKGKTQSITMSQLQIACLLANAFFCTFPRRNIQGRNREYSSYPDINFSSLFSGRSDSRKLEKLKCILNYFKRVSDQNSPPIGNVTFTRQTINQLPHWDESDTKLTNLHVATNGKIEDDGAGMLQVDFANKLVGGGVLGRGCVQEEIRFMICPEMIVSRLFTESLDSNECLIMAGCERYSNYEGYADSFKWSGDHIDPTERDEWGRCRTEVVAIDALVIRRYCEQFKSWCIKRELDKAYCGFYNPATPVLNLQAVCTGNWGCGAFGGEKQLKALIQLMAAAEAGRDVCYFTFDDPHLQKELHRIHTFLKEEQKLPICDILKLIHQYYQNHCKDCYTRPKITLFNYIYTVFEYNESSTDDEHVGRLSSANSVDYKAETP